MIPKECKRLIEVDFPIAEVSKHAAREKSIRHGHPSTLHLWWARRPLAACRAVLLGLLLPDPCDEQCPPEFKAAAWPLLEPVVGLRDRSDEELRRALLKFIGDFANWDLSANAKYLAASRGLVRAAHPGEPPLVVDSFAGGGSIPLEALRLGCEAFASDLNPVAALILKVMLEDIPRYGPGLADQVRIIGAGIKAAVTKELAQFYPAEPDGATPIAYLWARTVRCETPGCGAEIPLMRSFWLCKKPKRLRALRPRVIRDPHRPPQIELDAFEPKTQAEVPKGTVARAKATCPACHVVLGPERVRAQLAEQHGGADAIFDNSGSRIGGARMTAVVTLRHDDPGRAYRTPTDRDYAAVRAAGQRLIGIEVETRPNGPAVVPDEPLPPIGTLGFRVQRYGMLHWGDLFTARQKLALVKIAAAIRVQSGGEAGYPLRTVALSIGKLADLGNACCRWEPIAECPRNVLTGRLGPPFEFAEGVPTSESSASLAVCVDNLADGVASLRGIGSIGRTEVSAAQRSLLPDSCADTWFVDPPYYDQIPYAHLSDFFFVWLRRALLGDTPLHDPFLPSNPLTPKADEIVQDDSQRVDGGPKDRAFFEREMAKAFAEGRRVLQADGIGCVVFAHKTTEGWEALLSGLIRGGWTITSSWPVATELSYRLRAAQSAALGTSVHLVCRPRRDAAGVGDWAEVLRELPQRVGDWMERLQGEGVRGADLVFACIGPALEIFSRYSNVETAEGHEVPLADYLSKVWEVVGRSALEQVLGTAEAQARNGAAGALEEDARLTALFLWTLQSTAGTEADGTQRSGGIAPDEADADDGDEAPRSRKPGFTLVFDVVRRFAQPLGIRLPDWEDRIIETEKGVVRLLPVRERAKQLFGDDGPAAAASRIERDPRAPLQLGLFAGEPAAAPRPLRPPTVASRAGRTPAAHREPTTLDRVHAAMILQGAGQAGALRALIQAEQERGPDFLRLANALSALYPRGSEEKRLLDAMLVALPR